jgi:hypothetical protein
MDDAFAGSTCRCRHCGAIQTVPATKGTRAVSPTSGGASRTLYTQQSRRAPGSGLDELADVVASGSGLVQSAGENEGAATRSPTLAPMKSSPRVMILAGAAIGLAVGGAVVWMVSRGSSPVAPVPPPPGAVETPNATIRPKARTASFCGIGLNEPSVVYVIDRGASARESLGHMIAAALKSAESLGRDRRYQIIFWDNGTDPLAYPDAGPAYATGESLSAAARASENVVALGRTDAASAVRRAVKSSPGAIVLITAKGWELDDAFVEQVLLARGQSTAKIHGVAVGGSEGLTAMEKLAKATGGTVAAVSIGDLKAFTRGE